MKHDVFERVIQTDFDAFLPVFFDQLLSLLLVCTRLLVCLLACLLAALAIVVAVA